MVDLDGEKYSDAVKWCRFSFYEGKVLINLDGQFTAADLSQIVQDVQDYETAKAQEEALGW